MKSCGLLCLFALVAIASARPEYTDKYDNINLDEILENRRLLLPYLKCICEEGKCSPDGKELKIHMKEAMQEECAKCTKIQKDNAERVISKVINDEQDYWKKIRAKYDPEDAFSTKYENRFKKH